METNNPVNQILAPTGNQALLAAGARPDTLAIGQLGIFNIHTGLSVDGSVPADAQDIRLIVGTDPTGTGATSDINTSAGQMIQTKRAKYLTFKGYVAAAPKIVDITGFIARCQTEYSLKIGLRNGLGYALQGFNQINKSFEFTTGCCADQCAPCALGDTNELAVGLVTNINADTEKLVTASLISGAQAFTVNTAPTVAGTAIYMIGKTPISVTYLGTETAAQAAAKIVTAINASGKYFASAAAAVVTVNGVSANSATDPTGTITVSGNGTGTTVNTVTAITKTVVADGAVYAAANPGAGLGIRITAINLTAALGGTSVNMNYNKGRSTDIDVSLIGGFLCNGSTTVFQQLQRAEGLGYDLRQLEYIAGGWNGKPGPYRQSTILGQERGGFIYYINASTNYNVFALGYDIKSASGSRDYDNPVETILAVPCADNTTMASVATMFDLIFTQFGGMANDVAANGDCTNIRTGLLTPATDGLEALA